MNLRIIARIILSLPRSVILCLWLFPPRVALKVPLLISWRVNLKGLRRDSILINNPTLFGVKIGISTGSLAIDFQTSSKSILIFENHGELRLDGRANFSQGTNIECYGKIRIMDGFYCNKNCHISCNDSIVIGKDTLLGWGVTIRDSDGHVVSQVEDDLQRKVPWAPICIGEKVWLCARVTILKGVEIGPGSVVGYNSCVLRSFKDERLLIGGYPAKMLKQNIYWKK